MSSSDTYSLLGGLESFFIAHCGQCQTGRSLSIDGGTPNYTPFVTGADQCRDCSVSDVVIVEGQLL